MLLLKYTKIVSEYYLNNIIEQRMLINKMAGEKKWENNSDFTEEFLKISNYVNELENALTVKDLFFKFTKWTFKQCYPNVK